jgi:catechol 2,3-dioxygenase-like lactoylglutathione lyase family enzyme
VRVTRVLHTSVNVTDHLDDSRRFYAELFSLPDAERPDIPGVPGHWFDVGDVQLHLVASPAQGHGVDPTGPHTCFGVPDLEAAVAELSGAGVEFVRNGPQVWLTDPSGNTIELQQDVT